MKWIGWRIGVGSMSDRGEIIQEADIGRDTAGGTPWHKEGHEVVEAAAAWLGARLGIR